MLRALWNRWRYRRELSPVEQWVINEAMRHLPETARAILAQQTTCWQSIYRDFAVGEVLLYRCQNREIHAFPNRQLELKWLTLQLHSADGSQGRVRLYLVRGYLFSMHFTPPDLLRAAPEQLTAERVQFHADALELREQERIPPSQVHAPIVLPDWLVQLGQVYPLTEVSAPLEASFRRKRLSEMQTRLPEDYWALLEVCDGFRIGRIAVLGLAEIYSVALSDGEYWVMATDGERYLVVKDEDSEGTVYYLHYESLSPQISFVCFADALGYLLSQVAKGSATSW
ncbi:MAG: hypothetical protein KatS3mg016_1306 [Fimbriimonadales bacterium]|nr:MAG: hypothetical protein KatS3mg016_1306 [Fimbriimonadales bacterium]